ncbi:hypothetical protein ASPFODRAFT_314085 [Aspergillus luchuensis CBS 106.47]|uniref:Uncharacterized protein n=1 Tax=Aspergillus luchuensis (strain CBS 106.47) TaxID=1137211 RepID=A0A1M3T9A1_ASPLC|nr:hypothetical protein ASPFODRAFT_314085 [Aspergillus luchuensis CBS 106.47]
MMISVGRTELERDDDAACHEDSWPVSSDRQLWLSVCLLSGRVSHPLPAGQFNSHFPSSSASPLSLPFLFLFLLLLSPSLSSPLSRLTNFPNYYCCCQSCNFLSPSSLSFSYYFTATHTLSSVILT